MLNRRCDLADVAHINPHRFRHTWAHLFRAEGGAGATTCMYLAGEEVVEDVSVIED